MFVAVRIECAQQELSRIVTAKVGLPVLAADPGRSAPNDHPVAALVEHLRH